MIFGLEEGDCKHTGGVSEGAGEARNGVRLLNDARRSLGLNATPL